MPVSKAHIARFKKACAELNAVLTEVRRTNPEANYYLAEDSLHLMKGESHDMEGRAQMFHSVESVRIRHSGGGAW